MGLFATVARSRSSSAVSSWLMERSGRLRPRVRQTAPNSSLRNQYTAEAYYRFYLTEHLEITPDLQWVYHPSLNPEKTSLVYFELRERMTL